MRQMQSIALMGFLATLALTSASVLAIDIDVSVDKKTVKPGESITVFGNITNDGNPGVYDYRAAVIVAKHRNGGDRIIICDSGRQTTGSDGMVSFECKIPTISELESMGVENAADRAVIPIKGGIAAIDPETNQSKRSHGKALIVNTGKFEQKFKDALTRLDNFIAHAQELMARCDNITTRAEEAGAEHVIERCANFQEKLQERIDRAMAAQERINNAIENLGNLSSVNFEDIGRGLVNFRDGARDFKIDVKDLKEFVDKSRADLERRVAKEIAEKTRERAKEIRKSVIEKREALKREILEDRVDNIRRVVEEREAKGIRNSTFVKKDLRPASVRPISAISDNSENRGSNSVEDNNSGSSG